MKIIYKNNKIIKPIKVLDPGHRVIKVDPI